MAGQVNLRSSMRRADFGRITRQGRRSDTAYFRVFRLDREDDAVARLGVTVTRKVGNAVRRNRIKRLVREWFRDRRHELRGSDLVVIAKRDLPQVPKLHDLALDLDRGLGFAP